MLSKNSSIKIQPTSLCSNSKNSGKRNICRSLQGSETYKDQGNTSYVYTGFDTAQIASGFLKNIEQGGKLPECQQTILQETEISCDPRSLIARVRFQQDFRARFARQVFKRDVTDGKQKVSRDKDFAGYSHILGSSKTRLFLINDSL